MMKCCCLIVFLFCTIDVSNGGILSGICHSSNGTCGKRDVPCKETFGSEWTYIGKCCNKRPCCKFLKAPCVPETCPTGFKLLSNQASSANCYSYHGLDSQLPLPLARDNCATTAGAYLWRPNTEQEANAVNNEFNIPENKSVKRDSCHNERPIPKKLTLHNATERDIVHHHSQKNKFLYNVIV
ncbi:unnamed protein product [Mytilus edulis]|uniref:Uncharacterized protein n=1 Tax=Mytilus edulis TaxID=6550 RepID=A0A8S3V5Q4_MYTED|nr:unnamed protein product [Mytilus edulis]